MVKIIWLIGPKYILSKIIYKKQKNMKRKINGILFVLVCTCTAQNIFSTDSLGKEIKEEYIVNIFKTSKLVFCDYDVDQDSLGKKIMIKKMEVSFIDTMFFFSGYITSSPFFKRGEKKCSANFLFLDDGKRGIEIDEFDLQHFEALQEALDSLLRKSKYKKLQ